MMVSTADLIGTWRLKSLHFSISGGETHTLGNDMVDGLLIYSADGHMSATISLPFRPSRLSKDDQRSATPDEKIKSFDSYIAYCGRYSLQDTSVIHHVEMSLFPNLIGLDQERKIDLKDNTLVLTPPDADVDGVQWGYIVTWEKV